MPAQFCPLPELKPYPWESKLDVMQRVAERRMARIQNRDKFHAAGLIERGVTMRKEIDAARKRYDKERLDLEVVREEGKKLDEAEYQKELAYAMAYTLPANARNSFWFLDQEKET